MIAWFLNLFFGILKILKDNRTQNKFLLILFWVKIKIKSLFSETSSTKKINFLGYQIHYVSAKALCYLVEEIFIHHLYNFKTQNAYPIIYDAGANIGMSLIYFKMYYPKSQILAFEADTKTYQICLNNITENQLENIQLENCALWNTKTVLKFYTDKNSTAALNQGFFAKTDFYTEVPTELFSSYINRSEIKQIDFLKMDVEGAEKMVFQDLVQNQSLGKILQMCIECHLINGKTENLIDLLQALEAHHFKVKLGTHTLVNYEFKTPQDCMIYAEKNA